MRNIAVIGAGYWGRNLVRNLDKLGRLGWICDSSAQTLSTMRANYPAAQTTQSLDELLENEDVAGVMIATPSVTHYTVAKAALEAGKHTYVEKPLALDVNEGTSLCKIAEDKKLSLMVGHLLLYHPCVDWAKEAIDRGDLGEILYLNSVRVNLGRVRQDENAMWSLAPHDISVALHLLGGMPESVVAQGLCYVQPTERIHDVVFLTLRYGDGRAAQIHISWLDPHKKRQLTVVGTQKMLTFDDMAPGEKVRVYDKGVKGLSNWDAPRYESYGDVLSLRNGDIMSPFIPMREPLLRLCEDFLGSVDQGTEPKTPGHQGADVLKVLAAAQLSLDRGGVPVEL